MIAEIRTPYSKAPAKQVYPDTWRKKVLPVGDVNYKGTVLHFTPEYLKNLASAFHEGAYDQVPFQLAPGDNSHTNDPERYRGEIVGVEVQPDGLYVTAKTTAAGSKLLSTNPRLGVSARIVEGYDRSDGKYFEAAMQHVLGTLDPRIPNLGSWEAVEMSNTPDYIIDLSAATFAGEEGGGTMPDLTTDQQGRLARLLELDPDKLDALLEGMDGGSGDDGADYDADDLSADELASMIDQMDDGEFAELMAEYDVDGEPALAGASLSNGGGFGEIELTNFRLAEVERQNGVIQAELDRQQFVNEKRTLMGLGVPGYIVDMAQPLLEGTGHTIELSNGQGLDAGRLMRDVLKEYGRAASMLDLSGELGSAIDEPDTSQTAEAARRDFVTDFRRVTGI